MKMKGQTIPQVKFICRFLRESQAVFEYSRLCAETANIRFIMKYTAIMG